MRRWQSGQMQLAVNQSVLYLRGFKSLPAHKKIRPRADFDVRREGFESRKKRASGAFMRWGRECLIFFWVKRKKIFSNLWPNLFPGAQKNPPAKIQKGGGAAPLKTAKEPVKNIGSNHILILGEENFSYTLDRNYRDFCFILYICKPWQIR